MFAKTIVLSDAFLDMPPTARCLYFTLSMFADDDGFVNSPKGIMRQCGASEDDIKILIAKKFVLVFEDGVIVIKHWRINNYLQKDRYTETKYLEDKELLQLDENKAYTFRDNAPMYTQGMYTQDRIGKDSIDKDKDEINTNVFICENPKASHDEIQQILDAWNSLSDVGITSISRMSSSSQRYRWTVARLKEYGIDNVLKAIENVRNSSWLRSGKFNFSYDWFIRPNNFIKVLDGNYLDRDKKKSSKPVPDFMNPPEIFDEPEGEWLN